MEIATDASDFGWGIYLQGSLHRGLWRDLADAPAHINAKELMALKICLSDFLPLSASPRNILWWTDNTTALSYVRGEGGTTSPLLLRLTRDILLIAQSLRLRILPVYVPSEENLLADSASRFKTPPDWHLDPSIFRLIRRRYGTPEIDLFASTKSTQVPQFFAWGNAVGAAAFDALAQNWEFRLAYAFPPPAILPRVIRKMEVSTGSFILVTPFWPSQKWFPALLALRIIDVRRLPLDPPVIDLSTGAQPLPHLPLVVWRISNDSTRFPLPLKRSTSSQEAGGHRHAHDTMQCGTPSERFSTPNDFHCIPSI